MSNRGASAGKVRGRAEAGKLCRPVGAEERVRIAGGAQVVDQGAEGGVGLRHAFWLTAVDFAKGLFDQIFPVSVAVPAVVGAVPAKFLALQVLERLVEVHVLPVAEYRLDPAQFIVVVAPAAPVGGRPWIPVGVGQHLVFVFEVSKKAAVVESTVVSNRC